MDTVSWQGTVHLSESAFQLPQFYIPFFPSAGHMSELWMERQRMKQKPYEDLSLTLPVKQKHWHILHETASSVDVKQLSKVGISMPHAPRGKHRCKAFAHKLQPLGKLVVAFSWSEDGAVTDLLVSLVWAIRGRRKKWRRRRRRRRAFLISSQADRRKLAPHLSPPQHCCLHRSSALPGAVWLAHLVSTERRGTREGEIEKISLGKRGKCVLKLQTCEPEPSQRKSSMKKKTKTVSGCTLECWLSKEGTLKWGAWLVMFNGVHVMNLTMLNFQLWIPTCEDNGTTKQQIKPLFFHLIFFFMYF